MIPELNSVPCDSPDLDSIALQLAEHGYAVIPNFLPLSIGNSLVAEIQELWTNGVYREAAVGRGEAKQVRTEIRSDYVHWLNPLILTPPQQSYWNLMEKLREALNRTLFLGLFDYEAHLACYPPGASYRAHVDRHRESESRIVSAIVYLNRDWSKEDGGELRLYMDHVLGITGPFRDVVPEFGQLVLFLSGDFWHEVLPSRRERHSITGWYRRRDEISGAL
jgi:SM-20-related protein